MLDPQSEKRFLANPEDSMFAELIPAPQSRLDPFQPAVPKEEAT